MKGLAGLLCGLLLTVFPGLAAAETPLTLGIFPYLSTRLLLETYQPMREFLEQRLGRPIVLYTAPDFAGFVSRTQGGEYDIVATAPHFARLAQTDAGYQPMFAYRNEITAAIVVDGNSQINDLSQLRGAKIAAPDRIAIVTMLGMKRLRDQGLEAGRDYTFQWSATHGNVALAVLRGEVQAGIIGTLPFKQLPTDITRQLLLLATSTSPVSSQILLAHRRLTPLQVQAIKDALLQFEKSETGQKFFKTTGLAGIRPIGESDLKQLDPYAREVTRMLDPQK